MHLARVVAPNYISNVASLKYVIYIGVIGRKELENIR